MSTFAFSVNITELTAAVKNSVNITQSNLFALK